MPDLASPQSVVNFWRKAGRRAWFRVDPAFDIRVREQLEALHHAAARRELEAWAVTGEGCLALVLLLDQIPRNIYRGSAHAFATDQLALQIAKRALVAGIGESVEPELQVFLCMPFEHSEQLTDQETMLRLAPAFGPDQVKWARLHHEIIARFGRFPHRNAALGRESTAEETRFLAEGGFRG